MNLKAGGRGVYFSSVDFSSEVGGTLPQNSYKPSKDFNIVKENHIGSAVIEILWYSDRQTHTDPVTFI